MNNKYQLKAGTSPCIQPPKSRFKGTTIMLSIFFLVLTICGTYAMTINLINPTTTTLVTNESQVNLSWGINLEAGDTLVNTTFSDNGTNYTLIDDSTVMVCNFDNRSELGENDTNVVCWNTTGGGFNATVIGNNVTWKTNGKFNGAFEFNNNITNTTGFTTGYINTNYQSSSLNNSGWNIELWVKANRCAQTSGADIFVSTFDFRLYQYNNCHVIATTRNITSNDISHTGKNISINEWHKINYIYNNNTNYSYVYFDGLLYSSRIQNGTITSTTTFRIGGGGYSGYYFNGSVDDLKIQNTIPSDEDILKSYYSQITKYNSTYYEYNTTKNTTIAYQSYFLCSGNSTNEICSYTNNVRNVKNVNTNFSNSIGKVNNEFFGVNHAPRFITNYSWIDLNGDGSLDTHSNYTWIIQTLKNAKIVFLTDDMLLGSKTYSFANPSVEQWVNSSEGQFVNYTTKGSATIYPWGWGAISIDNSSGNATIGRSTDAHSGNYSYNISNVKLGGTNVYYNIYEPTYGQMDLNHVYNFSVWVKTSSSITLLFQRKDTYANICSTTSFVGSGNWQLLSCTANITEIVANGWRLNINFATTTGDYLLDDVSITNNGLNWWWLHGNSSSPSYSRTDINEDKEMLKTAYENGFVLQMNTLSVPKWLQNISSGCNITSYSITSGSCAPINYSLWGELVKEYVDEILDGHPERLSAFRIEEYNEADLSPWLNNYSTDDIRKATEFVLLHNATVNGVRPYYPTLEISLSSTSSALSPNMLPTLISNFSYNNDRYGWHRYTDNPYVYLQTSTDVMLGNCTANSANCSNWIIGEWNVASSSIKNYSDSSGGLLDANLIAQGIIWGLSNYPSNLTMVQYESMEDSSYKNTSSYAEWPSRWAMFSQAGLDNEESTYYWSYNVTKNFAHVLPAGCDMKVSSSDSSNLKIASCNLNNYYGMVLINTGTEPINVSLNLSLTNGSVFYPYDNLINYENGSTYSVNRTTGSGIVDLFTSGDSILDGYEILYLSSGVAPTITSIQPANLTYNKTSSVNFSANLTDDVGLKNSTIFIYNTSGTLVSNFIEYVSGESSIQESWLFTLVDSVYNWWIELWDDENVETISGNYTLTVDTIYPQISVVTPLNNTEFGIPTSQTYLPISINYVVTELNIFNVSYTITYANGTVYTNSSANKVISIPINLTTYGDYKFYINATDLAGNFNQSTINFKLTLVSGVPSSTGPGPSTPQLNVTNVTTYQVVNESFMNQFLTDLGLKKNETIIGGEMVGTSNISLGDFVQKYWWFLILIILVVLLALSSSNSKSGSRGR